MLYVWKVAHDQIEKSYEVTLFSHYDDNLEEEEDSEESVDEHSEDIDNEWNEFQNIAGMTKDKFKTFWQVEHFWKAFKKFKTKFAKLRNSN